MKRGIAFAFLVGVVGLLIVLWRSAGSLRRGGGEATPAEARSSRPVEAREALTLASTADVGESARRSEPALVEEREPVDSATPAVPAELPSKKVAHVRGRCVDAVAAPLADVGISGAGVAEGRRSAADGTFELDVDLFGGLRQTCDLVFARSGLGTRRVQALLRPEEWHDLGDVVLLPAGRVSGRVVDAHGRALGGAQVSVEEGLDLSGGSRFTGPGETIASGVAAENGFFLLEEVPAGAVRVWAGQEEWLWASTERLELAPGGQLNGLELVLEPLAPEDTIRLVVLDPAGVPLSQAEIQYHYELHGRSGTGNTKADENGRFKQFLDVRASYSFLASDPEKRYRPAVAHDVPPGTHDLVLQLGEKRTFRLRVEDAEGRPVERFLARVEQTRAHFHADHRAPDDGVLRAGEIELLAPAETFEVTVEAEGFELAELGPFEPAAVPGELVARLAVLPGVRGRVSSSAGPIADATVSLHEAMGAGDSYVVNGFRCLAEKFSEAETRTDEKGEYVLTLRRSGDWFVRAEAPGFAPTDLGPLHFEAGAGASALDLVLGRGGAITGRVIVTAGEDPSGRIVGLSRGDGHGFTGRTDAAGEYRFEGLTPGSWQVVWRKDEISTSSTTSSRSSGDGEKPAEIPWDCVVHEGGTTRFDLDLRALQLVTLSGRFQLGGSAPRDWSVSLFPSDDRALQAESASLDPDGGFHLTTSAAGNFSLVLHGELGGRNATASADIRLAPGENSWEADVPTGALRGRLRLGALELDTPLDFWSEAYPGLAFHVDLQADATGSFGAEFVPAGPARIEYHSASGESEKKTLDVPRGGVVEVEVP